MENIEQPDLPSSKTNNTNCNTKSIVSPTSNTKPSSGRYCHIIKRTDFDGYGFNLHSEKIKPGQYIGKVDPNSPAEVAGLREGDQIIEVNGVNIGSETHKQVVQRIKAISNEVRLLLIDPNTESVPTNTKTITGASEKNANKISTNNNFNSSSTTIPNSAAATPTTVPINIEANVASEHQKDEVTSIKMVSRKSQSTNSTASAEDVTDSKRSVETINNGHHVTTSIANGNSSDLSTSKVQSEVGIARPTIITTPPPPPPSQQDIIDSSNNKSIMSQDTDTHLQNIPGLNLNLTAAEMRAKLLAKKKFDPKNESVDLKKKFDIIQKL
ncbi:Na(+)/H(+) exchange regulatory cofactor NHE-RF1 [Eupeodes corollae]|uniref:Na(+)/H(+) exchange regulatory cofactor NHE-RF1 n=1 Tax=Eupeodes corollae TaxID=290404 RepID=UPI0024907933|nr:Na(+)/H(+) exchange regulatory cofactor NHE-RF1 [Eupeodes corollae]XP_055922226.1 Na(+)/H(+) exchange regulatory cofactor NHE-RF1 [Eupeodes corollae]XP_055922227.1 Na(+)/H(+) exchange regulatory cofactor NHE-RF1 [Eupeodes corollae]